MSKPSLFFTKVLHTSQTRKKWKKKQKKRWGEKWNVIGCPLSELLEDEGGVCLSLPPSLSSSSSLLSVRVPCVIADCCEFLSEYSTKTPGLRSLSLSLSLFLSLSLTHILSFSLSLFLIFIFSLIFFLIHFRSLSSTPSCFSHLLRDILQFS